MDDEYGGVAVVKDVSQHVTAQMDVDGHEARADLGQREPGVQVLGCVVHHHADCVAGAHAPFPQRVGRAIGAPAQLCERHRLVFEQEEGFIAASLRHGFDETADRHHIPDAFHWNIVRLETRRGQG